MIKKKKLIFGLILLLLLAALVSFFLLRSNEPATLKPGDIDPITGCTVGADFRGGICNL